MEDLIINRRTQMTLDEDDLLYELYMRGLGVFMVSIDPRNHDAHVRLYNFLDVIDH